MVEEDASRGKIEKGLYLWEKFATSNLERPGTFKQNLERDKGENLVMTGT